MKQRNTSDCITSHGPGNDSSSKSDSTICGDPPGRFAGMGNAPETCPSFCYRLLDAGDAEAWVEFTASYAPLIRRYCQLRGMQEADAADVTQEVMLAVVRNIRRFKLQPNTGAFRGWLFTITRSKFNDWLHRRRHEPERVGGTFALEFVETQAWQEPDQVGEREEEWHLFHRACHRVRGQFEDSTWQAFWKLSVEGHSGQDVAQALGISVGAVYIAKSRVLSRLKQSVQECSEKSVSNSGRI